MHTTSGVPANMGNFFLFKFLSHCNPMLGRTQSARGLHVGYLDLMEV
jgi:hypothetical protein